MKDGRSVLINVFLWIANSGKMFNELNRKSMKVVSAHQPLHSMEVLTITSFEGLHHSSSQLTGNILKNTLKFTKKLRA